MIACGLLAACAFLFGAKATVDVFGFNIFIAQTNEFEAVEEGSAVFVTRCEPYDVDEGNLVLYYADGLTPALGYVDDVHMSDGAYIIAVSDSSGSREIPRDAFVGRADTSSAFIGAFIRFARTPAGVLVMAVLPCAALVLYDIIKARIAKLPPPEVEPVYKNLDEDKPSSVAGISVKADGKAEFSRRANVPGSENPESADKVLFTYAGKQRGSTSAKPKQTPIIPLTDREERKPAPEAARASDVVAVGADTHAEPAEKLRVYPDRAAEKPAAGRTPPSVAARRYLDSAVQGGSDAQSAKGTAGTAGTAGTSGTSGAKRASTATAELPELPKKGKSDAFFTQSQAPQIGRQKSANRAVIDLEDALSSARPSAEPRREYAGKKSSAMIAGMGSDLFTEEDDSRDRERYEVDDILAGLEKRRGK